MYEANSLANSSPSVESVTEEQNHDENQHQYKLETEVESETQLENLDIKGLLDLAAKLADSDDFFEGAKTFRQIKALFDDQILNFQAEPENDDENAANPEILKQELKLHFEEAFAKFNKRKAEFRQKTEKERLDNLAKKQEIIDKIKEINNAEETEEHINEVRDLQSRWKQIRWVPADRQHEINESYRVQLDIFYDKVTQFYELKQKDRDKNLEFKIELCKKVDELKNEPSVKRSLIMLNKYWDEWKNTGPVPKESAEELYAIFKRTSDEVYELKKAELTRRDEERKRNLELKVAICEKLELLNNTLPDKAKEWVIRANEINEIFEDWKKVGPAPGAENEHIWQRFKTARNQFFAAKNDFFKEKNKVRETNLAQKVALCEQAEAIQNSEDWNGASVELKRLQLEWKKIGPVPEKQTDAIWNRFRKACDTFFNAKSEFYKDEKDKQRQNLDLKRELLEKFEELSNAEDIPAIFDQVKALQQEWQGIGYVPYDKKDSISKRYEAVMDKIYGALRNQKNNMNESRLREHYSAISGSADAPERLNQEARKLKERIRMLETEVQTWENNLGFFSKSSKNNPMVAQMEEKISKGNAQIERLRAELKIIQKSAAASVAK